MGPFASSAARSGILALSAFVIMSAIWCALMPGAPLQHKIDAFRIMLAKPVWWAMPLFGWLGVLAWMNFTARLPATKPPSPSMQVAWWSASALAAAIAMALLAQGISEVNSLISGIPFPSTWGSSVRLFESALFAVIIVGIALPLIPHFDRMPPRKA